MLIVLLILAMLHPAAAQSIRFTFPRHLSRFHGFPFILRARKSFTERKVSTSITSS
jgi:hypothetical protein